MTSAGITSRGSFSGSIVVMNGRAHQLGSKRALSHAAARRCSTFGRFSQSSGLALGRFWAIDRLGENIVSRLRQIVDAKLAPKECSAPQQVEGECSISQPILQAKPALRDVAVGPS